MSRPIRTATFHEPRTYSDLVKHEYGTFCREGGIIASGTGVVELGRVLGKITASGKWTSYNPAGVDGSQNAAAILLSGSIDATSADRPEAVLLVRGPAEIIALELRWGAGVTTQGHKDTAIAALNALGIILRAAA